MIPVTLAGCRVLIVEDERLVAKYIEVIVNEMGGEIVGPFGHLSAAISAVDSERFDIALVDMNLQGDKSFPIAELLLQRQIPFAFMSGYDASELPPNLQATPSIQKPCSVQTVVGMLSRLKLCLLPKPQAPS